MNKELSSLKVKQAQFELDSFMKNKYYVPHDRFWHSPSKRKENAEIRERSEAGRKTYEEKLQKAEEKAQSQTIPTNNTKRTPILKSDSSKLIKDTSSHKHGELVKSSDGNLFVSSDSNMIGARKYYMAGDLSTDENTLSALHKSDEQKKFQNGECHELAHQLYRDNDDIVDIDEVVYGVELKAKGETIEEGIHVIAKHRDGYYVDSLGLWSKEGLLDYWGKIQPDSNIRIGANDGQEIEPMTESRTSETTRLLNGILEERRNIS